MTLPPNRYTACPGCDQLVALPRLEEGSQLVCNRCGTVIVKRTHNSIDRVLIFSLTGIMLYLPAMLLPLMTLSSLGISVSGNVLQSALGFFTSGYPVVAIMVTLTAVLFPIVKLALAFAVTLQLKRTRRPSWLRRAFKLLLHLDEWAMIEIYLLGILISLIKVHAMASIEFGLGFYCFIGLVLLSVAASAAVDRKLFWRRIGEQTVYARVVPDHPEGLTAASCNIMRCHDCELLVHGQPGTTPICPRCGANVHGRKPKTIQRTWSLLVTSMIFIVPANILPIMQVDFFGIPDRSTIMDGIIYFFKEGSYGIGLIIFLASVLVPLFKIVGLMILLFTTHRGTNSFLRQKTRMFRFIEFIGRWSMLDIFVIALMTILVDFGFFTSVHTAPGASFFCIVVICTMMAAIVFDPRVMWDRCAPNSNQQRPNMP